MASERTILLTQLDPTGLGGGRRGKRKREGKSERVLEKRESTFSLDFPAIGSSNPGEARGKVDPHCKGYTWVLGLWSPDKLQEVKVFSYLVISCLKSHKNGFGSHEAENGHAFRFQGSGTEGLMRGLSLDGPRLDLGFVLHSPEFILD